MSANLWIAQGNPRSGPIPFLAASRWVIMRSLDGKGVDW